jgi:hypothetical protein
MLRGLHRQQGDLLNLPTRIRGRGIHREQGDLVSLASLRNYGGIYTNRWTDKERYTDSKMI